MRGSISASADEHAPFSFSKLRASYRRRMIWALVIAGVVVSMATLTWIKSTSGTKLADLAAGIIAAFVISTTIYLLESQRELSTRQLELAALVHNATSLRGLHLANENLRGLYLGDKDLRDANLGGCDCTAVVFCDSKLAKTILADTRLDGADLRQCDLREADLSKAHLGGADLRGADLSGAILDGADLTKAKLDEATLVGADLRHVTARGASFSGADLTGAHLGGAGLESAKLRHAVLRRAHLIEVDLSGADLSYSDFVDATVIGCKLRRATMDFVTFRPATFKNTSLADVASLNDATISGLDLSGMPGELADLGTNVSVSGSVVPVDELGDEPGSASVGRPTRFVPTDAIA